MSLFKKSSNSKHKILISHFRCNFFFNFVLLFYLLIYLDVYQMNNKSTLWKMPSIQRKFMGEIKTGACHSCLGFSKPVSTSDSMKQFCPSGHPGGSFCIKRWQKIILFKGPIIYFFEAGPLIEHFLEGITVLQHLKINPKE